jgi:hypothetical protein
MATSIGGNASMLIFVMQTVSFQYSSIHVRRDAERIRSFDAAGPVPRLRYSGKCSSLCDMSSSECSPMLQSQIIDEVRKALSCLLEKPFDELECPGCPAAPFDCLLTFCDGVNEFAKFTHSLFHRFRTLILDADIAFTVQNPFVQRTCLLPSS